LSKSLWKTNPVSNSPGFNRIIGGLGRMVKISFKGKIIEQVYPGRVFTCIKGQLFF